MTSRPPSPSPASSGRVALNLRMSPLRLPSSSVVELGHGRARADLVEEVGAGQLGDLLGVVGGPQVDLGEVVLGQRAPDDLELGDPVAQPLQLGVDVLVGDLEGRPLDLDAPVGGQVELGLDLEGGRELERLPVGVVGRLDLGPGQRLDAQLLDRLGVELGHRLLLDRLGQQGLAADPGLDHLPGHLALAEPGHPDLPRQPPGRAVDRRPELVGLHDHVDPHLGGLDWLEGAAHGCLRVGNGLNRAPSSGSWAREGQAPRSPGEPARTTDRTAASIRAPTASGRPSAPSDRMARGR